MAEYIEREAAYEKCGWYNTVNGKSVCAVRKDELAAIPAADVAPVVHGRWEEKFFTNNRQRVCSMCHFTIRQPSYDKGETSLWHYCPNCGARMDGE